MNTPGQELAALEAARRGMLRGMHYATVCGILQKSGLPYALVQDWRDDMGVPLRRGYRYRFAGPWAGGASLYIQETDAGRQHRSMHAAMDSLQRVLQAHAGSDDGKKGRRNRR